MLISLSILEYEPDLSNQVENIAESGALSKIVRLIQTGRIHRVHIDVMRPPVIPDKTKFSIDLMKQLYERLHRKIALEIHLMVKEPFQIIGKVNKFIPKQERAKTVIIIQRESYSSEEETIRALSLLKEYGYETGICLNLPTPSEDLTEKIVENADMVLLMSVPMGRGGQKYGDEATRRIADFSQRFPDKLIEVDGGIDPKTILIAGKAGAKMAVVGSFLTENENPERALQELERSLKCSDLESDNI